MGEGRFNYIYIYILIPAGKAASMKPMLPLLVRRLVLKNIEWLGMQWDDLTLETEKAYATVDGQNPFRSALKPWLKSLFVGMYTENNHSRVSERWCETDFASIHSYATCACAQDSAQRRAGLPDTFVVCDRGHRLLGRS